VPLPFAFVKNPIDRVNNMRAYFYARLAQHLSRRSRAIREGLAASDATRQLLLAVEDLVEGQPSNWAQRGVELHARLRYLQGQPDLKRRHRKTLEAADTMLLRDVFGVDPAAVNRT
jgi:hypothetical protein